MATVVPLSSPRDSLATTNLLSIQRRFRTLKDPRRRHLRRHLLLDIVVSAICAVTCGADDWQRVVTFARHRRNWLKRFLQLPSGIPSHDTFERVFDRLDPVAFGACFRNWMAAARTALGIEQIALSGKRPCVTRGRPPTWDPCMSSAPGPVPTAWRRVEWPSPTGPARSRLSRGCWNCSTSRAVW